MGSKSQNPGSPVSYAPPAPPTAANAAAVQAAADAKQKALEKKGIGSTLLSQENTPGAGAQTGNLFAPAQANNKSTLLGGG